MAILNSINGKKTLTNKKNNYPKHEGVIKPKKIILPLKKKWDLKKWKSFIHYTITYTSIPSLSLSHDHLRVYILTKAHEWHEKRIFTWRKLLKSQLRLSPSNCGLDLNFFMSFQLPGLIVSTSLRFLLGCLNIMYHLSLPALWTPYILKLKYRKFSFVQIYMTSWILDFIFFPYLCFHNYLDIKVWGTWRRHGWCTNK